MFGQGSKKGYTGKGKKGASSWWGETRGAKGGKGWSWNEPAADWASGYAADTEDNRPQWTRRLLGRESMVKKLLRPYASGSGDVLYSNGDDLALLQKASLRQILTPEISEMSRRPAYGVSMMGNSVLALARSLKTADAVHARLEVKQLLASTDGKEFLTAVGDLQYEAAKFDPAAKEKSFATVLEFLKHHKDLLYEQLPHVAVAAAREYMGSLQALEALVKADALKAWSQQVPDEEFVQKALDEFRQVAKPTTKAAAQFLTKAYKARRKQEAAWKLSGVEIRGDDSSEEEPRRKPSRRKQKSDSGDAGEASSEEAPKKRKKTTAPEQKKVKKAREEHSHVRSSSEASAAKRKQAARKRRPETKPEEPSGESETEPAASTLKGKKKKDSEKSDGEGSDDKPRRGRAPERSSRAAQKKKREEGRHGSTGAAGDRSKTRRERGASDVKREEESEDAKKEMGGASEADSAEPAQRANKEESLKSRLHQATNGDGKKSRKKKRKGKASTSGDSEETNKDKTAQARAEKARRAEEARTAAFTEWRQSDAQISEAALQGLLQQIGEEPQGTFQVQQLQAALALVPGALRPGSLPDLGGAEDMTSNREARDFIQQLLGTAQEVVSFYEAQQKQGSQASAAS